MSRLGDFALLAGSLALVSSLALASPEDEIRASLKKVIPDVQVSDVQASPIKGLYEVTAGNELMYVTSDGRYYIDGRIVDLTTKPAPTDLTEQRLSTLRKALVDKVGEDRMVVFGKADAKHTVTVFTDIECGYCRKLHNQIADYESEGIRVRYLFFPRAGKNSPAYEEAVSVWCAGDADARRAAMTKAKSGEKIPLKTCDNPVDAHMALGRDLGLRGTPAILTGDGQLIPGYVPPKRLAAELDGHSGS